nr:photosystem I light-harvesting complex chlorophyll a/b protein, p14.1 {N-terminal} [Chlamydomonas reinhardtii, Peptide Partial, 42 aa] [Chlamydomonas reinhardtii]
EEKSIAKVDRSKDQLAVGASQSSLAYLDGSLPGDFGFDPLGL